MKISGSLIIIVVIVVNFTTYKWFEHGILFPQSLLGQLSLQVFLQFIRHLLQVQLLIVFLH